MKSTSEKQVKNTNFFWSLALRSFVYHRRGNALFCAGCAVSTAILVGALLIGSSLKGSIRGLFEPRLGGVNLVLTSSSGQFRESIADSISTNLSVKAAPVLMMTGSVGVVGGDVRAHRVNIIGVDERFWELGPKGGRRNNHCKDDEGGRPNNRCRDGGETGIDDDNAIVNAALAIRLNINPGDQIIMRFQNTGALGMDAPFGMQDDISTLRLPAASIVDAGQFGDFSLKAEHFTVYNVFVPLALLQSANDIPQMANAVIIGKSTHEQVISTVQKSLGLKDAGLNLRDVDGGIEIYSDKIFINDALKNTLLKTLPGAIPVSAWFVNSIGTPAKSTPYSFVSSPPLSRDIIGNNIELTEWTARDINASIGDTVALTYFVPANSGRQDVSGLRVDTSTFVVSAVHRGNVSWINKSLMPPYPGLAGAGSCTDWDPSIPVDLAKIRPKDEEYWDRYQGTPKAIISYEKAARIWDNRFGVTTAVRIPQNISGVLPSTGSGNGGGTAVEPVTTAELVTVAELVEATIASSLTPQLCGMQLTDIRTSINTAVSNGIDFAPLFLGLSFFTFAASLILIWLLSTLQVKSRAEEHKVLSAVGYTRRHILLIYLSEGLIVFSAGTLLGILVSPFYTLAIISGLKSVWSAAAMTPVLNLHIEAIPVIIGGIAAFICALAAMLIPVYSLTRGNRKVLSTDISAKKPSTQTFDMRRFILLNIFREKPRALGEIAVLASALLILGTTQLFHTGSIADPSLSSSGTGGFAWYGELNSGIPREQAGVEFLRERGVAIDTGDIDFLSLAMRMRDGDDASCLSLNRSGSPVLLGADQALLDSLGAFSFSSTIKDKNIDIRHPWKILGTPTGVDKTVYGITDANTIEWGLGKSPGDKLTYINESGDTLNVILAAGLKSSIFQGKIIIAESDFIRNYPSISGYRVLLLAISENTGNGRPGAVAPTAGNHTNTGHGKIIVDAFESFHDKSGLQFESAAARLDAFNSVQNTYLSIFAVLGMMGLMLGCAGMGIIVMRNIEERRAELALLMVQGFGLGAIRKMLFSEHAAIAVTGALAGLLPALFLSWAAVSAAGVVRVAALSAIVLLCGAGSILLGLLGLRPRDLLTIIKDEV